ncbi:MAG TPA: NAD(P)H-dependent oxidoreductase subunit E [Anaerolineaceae bacterium]
MNAPEDFNRLIAGLRGEESDLIPLLQRIQRQQGYLSEESIANAARFLRVSENEIYGVASFYAQFRFSQPGRHSLKLCLGTACHVRGGAFLAEEIERRLGIHAGQTTPDGRFDYHPVACLGCCALAPVLQVDDTIYGRMNFARLQEVLDRYE